MEKIICLHFEDEKEVIKQDFAITTFMAYDARSMNFSHNGKVYKIDRKETDLDVEPICVNLYLKLCK